MRNVMLTLGLAATMAAGLAAQTLSPAPVPSAAKEERATQSPAERARKDAERAEKSLGLNSEQRSKWEAASLERANANEQVKEKMKGCTTPQERKDLKTQMRANHEKYNTTVTALLTPDQKVRYDQQKKEKRDAHRSGRMKGKPQHMQDSQK